MGGKSRNAAAGDGYRGDARGASGALRNSSSIGRTTVVLRATNTLPGDADWPEEFHTRDQYCCATILRRRFERRRKQPGTDIS